MCGVISIYAASYDFDNASFFAFTEFSGKQIRWIGLSFILGLIILLIDYRLYETYSYPLYLFLVLLLFITIFIAPDINGSHSWIVLGPVSIQPAEFAKFATALALAKTLSSVTADFKKWKTRIAAITIIFIPMLLILLQNDTGSALVFCSFVFVLFREGMSSYILIIGAVCILLFILALLVNQYLLIGIYFVLIFGAFLFLRKRIRKLNIWVFICTFVGASLFTLAVDFVFENVLEPHQKDRIEVLLGKKEDFKGVGYNVNQSKIAIGSGGVLGKGFLNGTQTKFNFVPEQDTDFIFCTIGEEWGFVGSSLTVVLFIALCAKLIKMAERQRSKFARIYGYSVASIIFFHFFINIGMTIGLLPVIGIPLPFISYGGSSLWAFTFLLFIFIKQDALRQELI